MYVIATAGHVDHGKSTLVRALTDMEPDRWAEERRRGLTIGLGFAWTTIDGDRVALVDVPGHERFVATMLAGVGPVSAVLFVVAADEGWMPQSTEHLAVLDALGVRHGVLAITRADLADPGPARARALELISRTSLGNVDSVAVSAVTGSGMAELRAALSTLARSLPPPDLGADVRLWVDRAFAIDGAGTVVTGTLAAGTIRTGDALVLASGRSVRVRGVQELGEQVATATAVARVAVSLRGVDRTAVGRGDSLMTPDVWLTSDLIDIAVHPASAGDLPERLVMHIGSAAVPIRLRPLGTATARAQLTVALPLRVGDRAVLREPGRHELVVAADVLDIRPPTLRRRGAARRRGADLDRLRSGDPTEFHLRQHGFLHEQRLRAMGLPTPDSATVGGWHADADLLTELGGRIGSEVDGWLAERPLRQGMPVTILSQRLELPDPVLLPPIARAAGLIVASGEVRRDGTRSLPGPVAAAVAAVVAELRDTPFAAPDANRLRELGLGQRELAAAVRAGHLVKIADGIHLLPDSIVRAAGVVACLAQPFTISAARQALNTTRRVAVPLLEQLDARGVTERGSDDTRTVRKTTP